MKYLKSILFIWLFILLFSGCNNNSSKQILDNKCDSIATKTFNGIAVDGYLQQAKVCLDINNDNICSSYEPSTLTNDDGSYSFTTSKLYQIRPDSKILVIGGIDKTTHRKFNGILKAPLVPNEDKQYIVSPVSTLVAILAPTNSDDDIAKAKENVSQMFGLDFKTLDKDPIKTAANGDNTPMKISLKLEALLSASDIDENGNNNPKIALDVLSDAVVQSVNDYNSSVSVFDTITDKILSNNKLHIIYRNPSLKDLIKTTINKIDDSFVTDTNQTNSVTQLETVQINLQNTQTQFNIIYHEQIASSYYIVQNLTPYVTDLDYKTPVPANTVPVLHDVILTKGIAYNTPINTKIATVPIISLGSSAVSKMEIVGVGNEYFTISKEGDIRISALGLYYDRQNMFNLKIRATNDAGVSQDVNFEVALYKQPQLNSNLPDINVDENMTLNYMLAHIDMDAYNLGNQNIKEYIVQNGDDHFTVSAATNALMLKQHLDYETTKEYNLIITAINDAGTSNSVPITVHVQNVPEPPVLTPISSVDISDEIQPNSHVVTFTVDKIGSYPISAYKIIQGNEKGYFTVTNNGELLTSSAVYLHYYEQRIYPLTVEAYTAEGNATVSFDINLIKNNQVYIRSAVYDNNKTQDILDDKLYLYFDTNIDTNSLANAPGDDFDIIGSGNIASDVSTDYNDTFFYRYSIGSADDSVEFNTSSDMIAIKANEITNSDDTLNANTAFIHILKPKILFKTSQATCFDSNETNSTIDCTDDSALKSDGYYQSGLDHNYTRDDNNDIVTDNVTNLMWEDQSSVTSGNYEIAIAHCDNLALGNYENWRLPTIDELMGLIEINKSGPTISDDFNNTKIDNYYWTTTLHVANPQENWTAHFGNGTPYLTKRTNNAYARCVREKGE